MSRACSSRAAVDPDENPFLNWYITVSSSDHLCIYSKSELCEAFPRSLAIRVDFCLDLGNRPTPVVPSSDEQPSHYVAAAAQQVLLSQLPSRLVSCTDTHTDLVLSSSPWNRQESDVSRLSVVAVASLCRSTFHVDSRSGLSALGLGLG